MDEKNHQLTLIQNLLKLVYHCSFENNSFGTKDHASSPTRNQKLSAIIVLKFSK